MWREAIQHVLISEAELRARVQALGKAITADYRGRQPVFVAVLKGAMIFCADLVRAVDLPLTVDCLSVSSYGADWISSIRASPYTASCPIWPHGIRPI
jgi:hypoxanthine phosphoribosyltransferase